MTSPITLVRPLRLRAGFLLRTLVWGPFLILLGLTSIIGGGYWQSLEAARIVRDTRLWETGADAIGSRVEGKVESRKFIFYTYNLTVRYSIPGGRRFEVPCRFDSVGFTVNQDKPSRVKYDPQRPDEFVLSWAHDVSMGRWLAVAVLGGTFVFLFGGGMILYGRRLMREAAVARACGRQAETILLDVRRVVNVTTNGRPTQNVFQLQGADPSGRPVAATLTLKHKRTPLYADTSQRQVVARWSEKFPKQPLALQDNYAPFKPPAAG